MNLHNAIDTSGQPMSASIAPTSDPTQGTGAAATGSSPEAASPPLEPGIAANLRFDVPAGVVVFLVALPLCLGIALASGAPALSGIVAGIAGGLVIPLVSRSPLSVSGPAAGLAAIVLTGIGSMGSFQTFALAVVLAGAMQVALGLLRAGAITHFFPSSVIKGMLTAIGVLLILKQLPHAIGFDKENIASTSFQVGDENTFTFALHALRELEWGALLLSVVSFAILLTWEKTRLSKLTWLPGPLAAVTAATLGHELMRSALPSLALEPKHLVALPAGEGTQSLLSALQLPDWSAVTRPEVWVLAVTIAIVASLETLLNLDAVDQLDPWHRKSPPNTELVAQGLGNLVSGLAGGLPVTSVIVRSSASVNAGARTKITAVVHGALLLLAVVFAGSLLTRIPLACLATILLMTGYKLAKPKVFASVYKLGWDQFIPFVMTVSAIVFTDLLKGIAIGLVVGLVFVLRANTSRVFDVIEEGTLVTIRFNKEAYFFSKGKLISLFEELPSNVRVVVDAEAVRYVDHDIADLVRQFQASAHRRNIDVQVRGL
jgi:MFS superfamily sulfate permease-like transporter